MDRLKNSPLVELEAAQEVFELVRQEALTEVQERLQRGQVAKTGSLMRLTVKVIRRQGQLAKLAQRADEPG